MSVEVEATVVEEATVDQGHLLFDRVARKNLGISGSEFIERLETNRLSGFREEDLARLVMLLPFS